MRILNNLSEFINRKASLFYRDGASSMYGAGEIPVKRDIARIQNECLEKQALYCRYLVKSELRTFYFQRRLKQRFLSLEYIVSGEFRIRNGKKGYVAEAGDLCLLHPGIDHDLLYDSAEKCTKLGIILEGQLLPHILKTLRLEHLDVIHLPDSKRLDEIFRRLRETLPTGMSQRACEQNCGCSLELLQMIANVQSSRQIPQDIAKILDYFEQHSMEHLNMKQIAAHSSISLPTLNKRFYAVMQMTPYQYLIRLRMHRAAYFLRENELAVKEISEMAGYNNPLHFSSEFRRLHGCSPREYRKKYHPGI